MYSWSTLRTLSVGLLCLPLLHMGYLLWGTAMTFADPSPEVWNDELQAIIEQDQRSRLPNAPILVTGGQGIRLWQSLPEALDSRPTLIRTPGDASLEDLTYHYDRLIGYYRPSVLIVQPAFSDMHYRSEKSPAEIVRALSELLKLNISFGATSQRYVLIPVKTLLHSNDADIIRAIADAARDLARDLPNTLVLDPNPLLADSEGRPRPDYFRFGGIFLNDAGYAVMNNMLRKQMARDGIISLAH